MEVVEASNGNLESSPRAAGATRTGATCGLSLRAGAGGLPLRPVL